MKFGNLRLLENSGPVQACNGTALPLDFTFICKEDLRKEEITELV
jgi:hypothetical protein